MEFYAENAKIVPLEIYQKLNAISEPPFCGVFQKQFSVFTFCFT